MGQDDDMDCGADIDFPLIPADKCPVSVMKIEQPLRNTGHINWYNQTRQIHAFVISESGFIDDAQKFMDIIDNMGFGIPDLQNMVLGDQKFSF